MTADEYRQKAVALLTNRRHIELPEPVIRVADVWARLAISASISEGQEPQPPRGDCYRCRATDVPVRAEYIGDTRATRCAEGCQ